MVDYERLAEASKKRGVTWAFLSQALGMSRYYLNTSKTRGADIPEPKLQKLAAILAVPVEYLRGEDTTKQPMGEVDLVVLLDQFRYRPECQLLFSALKDASPADVKKAVAIIDALKKANE